KPALHVSSSSAGVVWNLADLYSGPDDPRIESDLAECERRCTAFAKAYRPLFATPESLTPDGLFAALREYESIAEVMGRLGSYTGLTTAADTANDAYRRLDDRINQRLVDRQNQLAFFELCWLEVDDDRAGGLVADSKLANYAHYLSAARRYKPHTRS